MKSLFPALLTATLALQGCSEAPAQLSSSDSAGTPSVSRQTLATNEMPEYLIEEGFVWSAAKELASNCSSIGLRSWVANKELHEISDRAQAEGITSQQMKIWQRDPAVKAVAEERVLTWAKSRNITMGDLQAFCAAGKLEIAENTEIGKLLRAK